MPPTHDIKLFIVSFLKPSVKEKTVLPFPLQNDLIIFLFSVDLKEAHREYVHDAADKQTDEEGQQSVIPSSL